MRISDRSFYDQNRSSLAARRSDLAAAQSKASTGKRVQKPSDDPLAASLATKHRAQEQHLRANLKAIDSGRTRVNVQDSVLGDASDRLRRAQELALQGANGIMDPSDRRAIAIEISSIRDSIIGLANTQDAEGYVFAGYRSDAPAFDAAGVYQGDANVPTYDVGNGVRIAGGVTGQTAFDAGGADDVFDVLADLEAALNADDGPGIAATIDRLDRAHETMVYARADVGGAQAGLDAAETIAERMRDEAISAQTSLVGIDETEAYLDLQRTRDAYDAAVRIASQIPPQGLVSQ
ncbi:MAG: flagellar hook-associated protein 3 FlgL [Polyangiales bacterium]|jgi:flagellar hook-associated protein 3 FlgL